MTYLSVCNRYFVQPATYCIIRDSTKYTQFRVWYLPLTSTKTAYCAN